MSKAINVAHAKGRLAYIIGKSEREAPYEHAAMYRQAWLNGFQEARREDAERIARSLQHLTQEEPKG